MTPVDHLAGIWGLSLCLWGLYCLYCIFSIKKFIVKRYEQETDLLNTVYFKKHFAFARYLYSFHSSALYATHLLLFVWGWRFVKFVKEKRPTVTYFVDIDSPEVVTRHFTANEIWRVKRAMIVVGIVVLHGVTYFIF
jgi:hypothetical protein